MDKDSIGEIPTLNLVIKNVQDENEDIGLQQNDNDVARENFGYLYDKRLLPKYISKNQ